MECSKAIECTKCDYKTIQATRLKKHIKTVHEIFRGMECTECNYKTVMSQCATSGLKHRN